jgi:uncharacterized protein (UPF0332 family)
MELKEDLVKYRKDRAFESLKEAKAMIENEFWNAAINRIYYSCFYIISAILINIDVKTNSHKGIKLMLGLHFIQTGLIDKKFGRFFSDLFDKRHDSDYDDFVSNDSELAQNLLIQAIEFVNELSKFT